MSESPNPALALLEFERRIQSATSNREVAFRAVNDASQVLDFDQAVLWRMDIFGRPLIDVVNTNILKAQIFVPASWTAWLRPGAPLTIHVKEIGQSFDARVAKLNSRIDGVSQQLEVEARIDKGAGSLLPGMVGTAVFPQRKP